jgi:hypothetical protein
MTGDELRAAYREALAAYETARVGSGNRVEAFIRFLTVEQALAARLGVDPDLQRYRDSYHP